MAKPLQYCRICGDKHPGQELSNRGICGRCGDWLFRIAAEQMQAKRGPIYEKWRRNYIASMEATISKMRKEV